MFLALTSIASRLLGSRSSHTPSKLCAQERHRPTCLHTLPPYTLLVACCLHARPFTCQDACRQNMNKAHLQAICMLVLFIETAGSKAMSGELCYTMVQFKTIIDITPCCSAGGEQLPASKGKTGRECIAITKRHHRRLAQPDQFESQPGCRP